MKIKMKDAGESPEFGPFEKGRIFDEKQVPAAMMKVLVKRGVAEWTTKDVDQVDRVDINHGKAVPLVQNNGNEEVLTDGK